MRIRSMLLLAAGAVALHAGTAAAQTTAADNALVLEEIVVTATKRATNLQDTPIAIRAFGSEDLRKSGVSDINGLTRLAPDLSITNDTIFTKISVRGVSSQDVSEAADPALTIGIDGEYINRPVALNASFFDLERIEVLRGPQGTLYGRNATAGAINIIAAKPQQGRLTGFATVGYGNYNAKRAEGAVNVPVTDTLAVRVSGMHTDHDGYRKHGAVGRGENQNVDAARISAGWEPTDNFRAYIAGEYVNVDQLPPSQFGILVAQNGVLTNAAYAAGIIDAIPSTTVRENGGIPSNLTFSGIDKDNFPLGDLGNFNSEQYALRGRIEVDFDLGTLAYLGGYRDNKTNSALPLNGYLPATFTFRNNKLNSETQSHEVRLSKTLDSGLFYQAGAFYFREKVDLSRGLYLELPRAFLNYFYRPDILSTSKAAFGQVTVPLAGPDLSVTGGLRYTDDAKSATFYNYAARFGRGEGTTPPAFGSPGATILNPRSSSDQITGNIGIDWKPAPDSLVYGKVSTGYKSGGFDSVGDYDPEELTAYEVGTKNRFDGGRIQFNASAFYYDYKDQQIQVFVDNNVGARTLNAGKSRVWGVETDTSLLLTANDELSFTVNYLDAKVQDFATSLSGVDGNAINDSDPATPGAQPFNLKGNRPPQAPKWTLSAGYSHTFDLSNDANIVASVFSRYKGTHYLSVTNWAGTRQKGYVMTDLSLEYNTGDGDFSVQAYVRNVENKQPLAFANFNAAAGALIYNSIYGPPRTFGAQVTYRF
ncbi:TonB-dependent receptor [Niveispirillum sp. KHB5.9]|uniref:TonB-dependent receptor n=1 Tax=Niveispirillum sp. KHB5.9 TaxID=3400269 RepID=UPI003A83FA15